MIGNKEKRILDQENEGHQINREYKDRLFCKVFEDREDLLELYNAVNGTDYKNTEALEVNTLEDVIYLGMKNDKSFLISETMNLYEHNSTWCPNLPLRGLLYFSRLYEGYVESQGIRIYGTTKIGLPTPQYVIFYNGTKEEPDRSVLRLSDAFTQREIEPALECRAVMLNINYGHNSALMGKCRKLKEYALFVAVARDKLTEGKGRKKAVEEAVDECIERGVLRDILVKNRAEVVGMILTSFDQEEYEKTIRDESYREGVEKGVEQGMQLGQTGLVVNMLKNGLSPDEIKKYTNASDEVIRQAKESLGQ